MTPEDAQKVLSVIKDAHGYIRDMTYALGGADEDDKVLLGNLNAAAAIVQRVSASPPPPGADTSERQP